MQREILIYVDLKGAVSLVGRLWTRPRKNGESVTFEYDRTWLSHPSQFPLDPILTLNPGPFHTGAGQSLFGAMGDSAPDRWGRTLMRRAERRRAQAIGETPRTLQESDFLLMVSDEARQGALRFATSVNGPFLAATNETTIPPLLELPKLLSATEHLLSETETDEDLRLLLAPGSSLGGARPKASVRDRGGELSIAKFNRQDDDVNSVLWEALALTLARNSGIRVPKWRVEMVAGRYVLLLSRFDREKNVRIPFLSAMSMLGANDNETHSYLEIVEAIQRFGSSPKQDSIELWRRIVFNVLISNTDDHLRNHGFLCPDFKGWILSPAYDMNPVPRDVKPPVLSTAISVDDATASIDLALEVAPMFELSASEAKKIVDEVRGAVNVWRHEAAQLGIKPVEINRMASAFAS